MRIKTEKFRTLFPHLIKPKNGFWPEIMTHNIAVKALLSISSELHAGRRVRLCKMWIFNPFINSIIKYIYIRILLKMK